MLALLLFCGVAAAAGPRLADVEAAWAAGRQPGGVGADPVRVVPVSPERRLVVLAGTSELLLTDAALRVVDRKPAPRGACGLALIAPHRAVVCGELSGRLALYDLAGDRLVPAGELAPAGLVSARDVCFSPRRQRLYVADRFDRQLVEVALDGATRRWSIGPGADRVRCVADYLVINLVLAHQVLVLPLTDAGPEPLRALTLTHSGPVWGFAAASTPGGLNIAVGGVEDFPLDRTAGEFDHMDSYLYLHEVRQGVARTGGSVNLSALGVLTPRALAYDEKGDLWVAGSGSRAVAQVAPDGAVRAVRAIPPGAVDLAVAGGRLDLASPLADAVYALDAQGTVRATLELPGTPAQARLGEYLVFTDMLSPRNVSDGARSRLTCEACHFEGDGDGRVHWTGRDTVRLTPKSIRGLVDNVPLFSRAGDPSMATMTMAEFRVANQHRLATFDADMGAWPGLRRTGTAGPAEQREAFLAYLAGFAHRPNPAAVAGPLDEKARRGLAVFRQRCADCHQARLSTREPARYVPFERWAAALTEGPAPVWGAPFMAKTGLTPYPSPKGTRVPSLRRIWTKFPYFSNGSSLSLSAALARFRHQDGRAWHAPEPGTAAKPLTPSEIDELLAALRYF